MPLITETGNTSNSHQSAALEGMSNEFIPYISFDKKSYKSETGNNQNDTVSVSDDETAKLEKYFKEDFKNKKLDVISVVGEVVEEKNVDGKVVKTDKLYLGFDILNGTGEDYDPDGVIDIIFTGADADKVSITEPKELPFAAKFSDHFLIEVTIDVTEQKKEMLFYVDFIANDNKGLWLDDEGETKDVLCGRVKVEYAIIEIKSKTYFYSKSNGEFLGEIDSEFNNDRTIIITSEEWDDLKTLSKLSLKSEETKIKSKIQFDWTEVNRGGLPSLGRLIHEYPTDIKGSHRQDVTIDHNKYFNQCAIRLSYGLTNSNFSLAAYPDVNKTKDGFARSSKGLADWLYNNLFIPEGVNKDPSYFNENTAHGIIFLWDKEGISHIDVIYGGQTGSGYYGADEIWYWELK